jgi:hypothetical protein
VSKCRKRSRGHMPLVHSARPFEDGRLLADLLARRRVVETRLPRSACNTAPRGELSNREHRTCSVISQVEARGRRTVGLRRVASSVPSGALCVMLSAIGRIAWAGVDNPRCGPGGCHCRGSPVDGG